MNYSLRACTDALQCARSRFIYLSASLEATGRAYRSGPSPCRRRAGGRGAGASAIGLRPELQLACSGLAEATVEAATARLARDSGIRVYPILIGTHGKVPYPARTDAFGRVEYEQVEIDIDPELLQDMVLAATNEAAGMGVRPGPGRGRGTLVNALLHRWGRLPAVDEARPGTNLGYGGGVNRGASRIVNEDFVLVMNADVVVEPGAPTALAAVLDQDLAQLRPPWFAGPACPRRSLDEGDHEPR